MTAAAGGRTAGVVSFRLGGTDGVSIEAAKWGGALRSMGFTVRTVAGAGTADVVVPGLAWGAVAAPSVAEVADALDGCAVVVVENLLSLPLNPAASAAVAAALRGRPAIVRHHDLPWQRPAHAAPGAAVPDDAAWVHVVINSPSAAELASRGIESVVLHNRFPLEGWAGGAPLADPPVLLHPARAIARKDVPAAVRIAEALGATYWLTGAAEEGYETELAAVLSAARCPVRHEAASDVPAAYAAASAVAFPSIVEGFGNPVIESALARRPLAVRPYPVLVADLAPFGFRWFPHDDAAPLAAFLREPDPALLDHNEAIARAHFGLDRLPAELAAVLERVL